MSGSPTEHVVRAYFEAVDSMDVAALLALFDLDAVYERPGYDAIVGRAALERFYREDRLIRDGRHEIEGIVVEESRGAAWGSFVGTSRTGGALAERWADVYRFRVDRIAYRRTHFFRAAI